MSAININKFTQQSETIAPSGTKLLLVVLPYLVKTDEDIKKKLVRSFLAFPYGVLTIASYVKSYARNNPTVEVLDLNIENALDPEELFKREVSKFKPDIIGFSMSYDISFKWLKSVSNIAKKINPNIVTVAGGPAVTVAYEEILADAESIDALCYSEGELGLLGLVESPEPMKKLDGDPWITKDKIKSSSFKPTAVYEDLDKVIDVDYELVDVSAYSMKEAFSPFVKFHEGAKQFFIVTSRGCPFECVFCAEPSFHGANMRYANVDLVVEHITSLVKNYGLTVLTIYDDQLLM
ncbi:MAG: hypothetical protein HOH59_15730, partial [Rhodospirillaceae bacterium]|nr:hypothetical protein [Rhodospirillaceae bacterium]